jgi:hypothetical protein
MQNYCEWRHQADDLPIPQLELPGGKRREPELRCPQCQRPILLVDVTTACRAIQKSRNTIYRWIEKEWIRTVPLADGWRLIVYSLLFDKPLLKFDRLTGEPMVSTATAADARKDASGLRLVSGRR